MTKTRLIKVLGLVAALCTSVVSAMAGDYVTAVGIVSAAFSSATAIGD